MFKGTMQSKIVALRRYVQKDEYNFISVVTNPKVMKYVGGVFDATKAKIKISTILNGSEKMQCWAIVKANEYVGHASLFSSSLAEDYEKEILFYLLPHFLRTRLSNRCCQCRKGRRGLTRPRYFE